MLKRFPVILAGAALIALGLTPAPARAATSFGADLRRAPDADFDCTVIPGSNPAQSNNQTCSWSTVKSRSGSSDESFVVPPGEGTVTRIRVRVGRVTGPMQVVVLEGRYADGGEPRAVASCCKEINRTGTFSPRADAVTALDATLPVRNDRGDGSASGERAFDMLALSVLKSGVPIPAADTGLHGRSGPSTSAWWPAWQPGQERPDHGGPAGYVVLLSADWEAAR